MSSTADPRLDAGAPTPTLSTSSAPAARGQTAPGRSRSKPSPSPSLTCWDCDAQNPPDRLFCIACGTFIAVGAKPFSRRPSAGLLGPVAALATSAGPTMSLGSYSVAMRRYEQVQAGRRRLLLGLVSAVLATVVGVAAIHLATTPRGPAGDPAAGLLVAPSAAPVLQSEGKATQPSLTADREATGEPKRAAAVEAAPTPSEAATAEATEVADRTLADVLTVKARASSDPSATDGDPPTRDRGVAAAAEQVVQPEPVSTPARVPDADEAAVSAPASQPSDPRAQRSAVWRNGWVCDGELTLADRHLRGWAIRRASFLPGNGYERVVLNLERAGSGSRSPATVRAEAFPTASVSRQVPRVRQPSAGRSTIALQLANGIKSDLSLRSYRPRGLRTVKELSIYPVGRRSARVLVSAAADGCFRVRTPAWNGSPDARKAQIYIDIKR